MSLRETLSSSILIVGLTALLAACTSHPEVFVEPQKSANRNSAPCTVFSAADLKFRTLGGMTFFQDVNGLYECVDLPLDLFEVATGKGKQSLFLRRGEPIPVEEIRSAFRRFETVQFSDPKVPRSVQDAVGRITFKFEAKGALDEYGKPLSLVNWCTGTHIGAGYVLTANHCANGNSPTTLKLDEAYIRFRHYDGNQDISYKLILETTPISLSGNNDLDYAVLKIDERVVQPQLIAQLGVVDIGDVNDKSSWPSVPEKLSIVQHPLAQPMRAAIANCYSKERSRSESASKLKHTCNTWPISSGSMVLSRNWKSAIGIHLSGVTGGALLDLHDPENAGNTASRLEDIKWKMAENGDIRNDLDLSQNNTESVSSGTKTIKDWNIRGKRYVQDVFLNKQDDGRSIGITVEASSEDWVFIESGDAKITIAKSRNKIDEFCDLSRFDPTSHRVALTENEFAVIHDTNGELRAVVQVKSISIRNKPHIRLNYWISDRRITNFSTNFQCNNEPFQLFKSTTTETDNAGTRVSSIAFDYENYRDGIVAIGHAAKKNEFKFSWKNARSIYMFRQTSCDDRKGFVINTDAFLGALDSGDGSENSFEKLREDRARCRTDNGYTAIGEGQTWVEEVDGRTIAISLHRVYARDAGNEGDVLVFDYWEFDDPIKWSGFTSAQEVADGFKGCSERNIVTTDCNAEYAYAGYSG